MERKTDPGLTGSSRIYSSPSAGMVCTLSRQECTFPRILYTGYQVSIGLTLKKQNNARAGRRRKTVRKSPYANELQEIDSMTGWMPGNAFSVEVTNLT